MRTDSGSGSKATFKTLKAGFMGLGAVIVVYYVLLFTFGVKYLDPEYYGSYFYAWRVNFADKLMTHGRYKLVKKNEHPDTEDRRRFYSMAQEDGGAYLIRFDWPEHFPRGFEHQFSLNFPGYKEFLAMRERYIVATEGQEEMLSVGHEELVKEMKTRKEGNALFFADWRGKSVNEVIGALFPQRNASGNPWFEVSKVLQKAVSNIMSGDEARRAGYLFDGEDVGPELMADIKKALKAFDGLEEEGESPLSSRIGDDEIRAFFVNNGRVSATPYETFAYSRVYYLFDFLTAGIEFKCEKLASLQGDEERNNEFREARMGYVANVFARVFASIYPNGHSKDVSDAGTLERIRNYYSPKMTVDKEKEVDDADMELVRQSFEEPSKVPA